MIRYAGVPTLLPSPEVEQYINALIGDVSLCPDTTGQSEGHKPSVPAMNWQREFRPQVNTLHWPTGASRWASMYLLVDSARLATIVAATSQRASGSSPWEAVGAQLQICDSRLAGAPGAVLPDAWTKVGESIGVSTEMFALQPRPLSLPYEPTFNVGTGLWEWAASAEKTLWLLPIVDERWLWQWTNLGEPTAWTTWNETLEWAAIQTGTSASISISTISENYGEPPVATEFHYANAAEFLDAVANSVGQRIVRDLDGSLHSLSPSDGTTRWNSNLSDGNGSIPANKPWHRLSGGIYSGYFKAAATVPEHIRCVFTAMDDSLTVATASVSSLEFASGTERVIFTGANPELPAAYAQTVAATAVAWLQIKADVAYAGVKSWRMTGFEDVLCLTHGSWNEGQWSAATRIATLPENVALSYFIASGGPSPSSGSDSGSGSGSEGSGSDGSGGTGGSGDGSGGTGGTGDGSGGTGDGSGGTDGSGGSGGSNSGSGSWSGSGGTGGTGGTGNGSGSGKDTAIVPAYWSSKGYAALFVLEAPEVRFDDVIVIEMSQQNSVVAIDPKYVEVCEPGSIEVCGSSVNQPVLLGATVDGGLIDVTFAERQPDRMLRVVLRLTGIRKGFAGMRFPDRSKAQFDANERFIRSAYQSEE